MLCVLCVVGGLLYCCMLFVVSGAMFIVGGALLLRVA